VVEELKAHRVKIKSVALAPTMGPGVRVDLSSL